MKSPEILTQNRPKYMKLPKILPEILTPYTNRGAGAPLLLRLCVITRALNPKAFPYQNLVKIKKKDRWLLPLYHMVKPAQGGGYILIIESTANVII